MDETVGGGGGAVSLTRDLGSCPIIIVVYYIISLYYMCIVGGGVVFRAVANDYLYVFRRDELLPGTAVLCCAGRGRE